MAGIIVSDPTQPVGNALAPGKAEDPFRIGWRDIDRTLSDGTIEHIQIPLTAEDALHPERGDVIVENTLHNRLRNYLADVLRKHLENDPHALVLSDTGVYWDEIELRHHSPDISVIFGVSDSQRDRESIYVAEEGTRPRLIIEIASPSTRDNDVVKKFRQYHQARVPYYAIIDVTGECWRVFAYQSGPSKYVPIAPDDSGRFWLEPVGLWLGLKGNGIALYDGKGGAEIGDYSAVTRERDAAVAERNAVAKERDAVAGERDAALARASSEAAARLAAEQRIRELEEKLKLKTSD